MAEAKIHTIICYMLILINNIRLHFRYSKLKLYIEKKVII